MTDILSWPSHRCRASIFGLLVCLMIARPAAAQLDFETLQVFNGPNGGYPQGPMVQAANGWIYGLTESFVDPSTNTLKPVTVYRFDPTTPAATFETVWTHPTTGTGVASTADGGLVQAGDGNLYFALSGSGTCSQGRVYRVTPPTTVTLVHEQCDAANPPTMGGLRPGLAVGIDGVLYGLTLGGSSHPRGAVYRLALDGSFSLVASLPSTFLYVGGASVRLVAGSDGRLYGTNERHVYRADPVTGVVDVLHEFSVPSGQSTMAVGRLLEVSPLPGYEIAFVGARERTPSFLGVIYRMDVDGDIGTETVLHTLDGSPGQSTPKAGLIADGQGNLYGTASTGLFKIATNGVFSLMYYLGAVTNPNEEVVTFAPLLLASDGDLYGTTYKHSVGPPPVPSLGSVFRLSKAPQAPLSVTDAPPNAAYDTSFTVGTAGGSGTGAVTFAASDACTNVAGGALITMTSGTGSCSITATKAGDDTYKPIASPPVVVTALKAAQAALSVTGAPESAATGASFTVGSAGGSGTGVVTFAASGGCTNEAGGALIVISSDAIVCSITATKAADSNYETAISPAVQVNAVDTVPPTVSVVQPNGGEKLFAGTPFLIEWTGSDNRVLTSFDVAYSVNGGASYEPVPGCSGVGGALRSCSWISPGPLATTARIRVTATDGGGNTAGDASNANFSIVSGSGSITVTAPSAFADWGIGSTQQIKWSHTLGVNAYVRIDVSRDGRETWEPIAASFKNTGNTSSTFNWVVTGPPVNAAARVRVTWVNGSTVSDVSNVDISISNPYVALPVPTTPSDIGYGTSRTQSWATNLGPLDNVNVLFSEDGGATFPHLLVANIVATKKKATFSAPALSAGTNTGRFRVEWSTNGSVRGTTPIDVAVAAPYVKVTQPNVSDDVWTVGSTATILWASNLGDSEKVKIELSLDGGATYPIVLANSTVADGSHSVNVQAGWVTASARVRITWVENGSVSDASATSFGIH